MKLLDAVDPAFGWAGCSARLPQAWRKTAAEVDDHIRIQSILAWRRIYRLKRLSKRKHQRRPNDV